jgi:hypothetical protein
VDASQRGKRLGVKLMHALQVDAHRHTQAHIRVCPTPSATRLSSIPPFQSSHLYHLTALSADPRVASTVCVFVSVCMCVRVCVHGHTCAGECTRISECKYRNKNRTPCYELSASCACPVSCIALHVCCRALMLVNRRACFGFSVFRWWARQHIGREVGCYKIILDCSQVGLALSAHACSRASKQSCTHRPFSLACMHTHSGRRHLQAAAHVDINARLCMRGCLLHMRCIIVHAWMFVAPAPQGWEAPHGLSCGMPACTIIRGPHVLSHGREARLCCRVLHRVLETQHAGSAADICSFCHHATHAPPCFITADTCFVLLYHMPYPGCANRR